MSVSNDMYLFVIEKKNIVTITPPLKLMKIAMKSFSVNKTMNMVLICILTDASTV